MSTTILVSTAMEAPLSFANRIAVLKDGRVTDLDFFRDGEEGTLDSIYRGRVERVSPMGYFIDLNLSRPALLPLEKNFPKLQEGQSVLVQITREAVEDPGEQLTQLIAQKGCQISRKVTLAKRGIVYHPHRPQIILSQKITDPAQRERLSKIRFEGAGLTLRQVAQEMTEDDLRQNYSVLKEQFSALTTAVSSGKPGLLLPGPSPLERLLRDSNPSEIDEVIFDDAPTLAQLKVFCQLSNPFLLPRLRVARMNERPLFEHFGIEETWSTLLSPLVPLPNGGNMVIESTACLTSIDVNKSAPNSLEANLIAIPTIAEQMRLRHLSGNIVIDFIGTDKIAQAKKKIIQTLQNAVDDDPIPTYIHGWSPLGWLELRRERRRPSLTQRLLKQGKLQ